MQASLPKQYLPLLGRPVVVRTLERFGSYPKLRGLLVGIVRDDPYWDKIRPVTIPKLLGVFEGGATRAQTVLNGLKALASHARADDWVMVHDAVRPCVQHADLDRLIEDATNADGGLLAIRVTDTVKRTDDAGRVMETVSRATLWRALTPQMFRLGELRTALEQAIAQGVDVTDESAAMERLGKRPRVVEGHADNIKITLPADLALAELYLRQQGVAS